MTHAYRDLDVTRGSAIQMLLPILTGLGGVMLFGESFTPLELAGAALTLVATWQVLLQPPAPPIPRRASPRPTPAPPTAARRPSATLPLPPATCYPLLPNTP